MRSVAGQRPFRKRPGRTEFQRGMLTPAADGGYEVRTTGPGPIGAVYFEEVRRHLGTDAAHIYGGLLGVVTAWCEEHEIPYQGVPVGEIKKHATGKGNADKGAMIAAAKARGHQPGDDNEADAIAIAYWRRAA